MICPKGHGPLALDTQTAVDGFFHSVKRERFYCLSCGYDTWTGPVPDMNEAPTVRLAGPKVVTRQMTRHARRKAQGLCHNCNEQRQPGRSVCQKHHLAEIARRKATRERERREDLARGAFSLEMV